MTKQSGFTIIADIAEGEVERLGNLLDDIGDHIDDNPHLRFADLDGLHYASFVIIEHPRPYLLFEGNVDGPVRAFLEQLVATAGDAVAKIYFHCTGFPSSGTAEPGALVDYLASRDIGIDAFYIAWPGRTVQQVRAEQELRDRLEELLDAEIEHGDLATRTPEQIHQRLQNLVRADPSLDWARRVPPKPFLVRNGPRVLLLLAAPPVLAVAATVTTAVHGRSRRATRRARATLVAGAALIGAAALELRRQEKAHDRHDRARHPDWETVYARWSENLAGIVQRENVQGQNHLASVTAIQDGAFRLAVQRVVLWAVNLVAALTANKGSLAGITSIHFARWVITPDRRYLIFLSNFDGSWERYLNDFIDLASKGLTAVWTNTDNEVGFPSTRWLILDGARDEQRFKSYARYSQVRTRAWYSAYPNLSNENIANNRAIREQLFVGLDRAGAEAWLRRL